MRKEGHKTMNSLREEISELLVYETFDDYTKANLFTYQIIKKIEKRIDSIADTEWFDNIHDANMFRQLIDKVKEMLK